MSQQNSQRSRRRGRVNNPASSDVAPDRYQKFLPEWMRATGGAPPPRPPRPKRARAPRPAGGYTPGKFAAGDSR